MKSIITLLLLIPVLGFSQVSVIQDKSGETSVLIGQKTVAFNSGDASIGANFSFGKSTDGNERFYGFSLKVKSNEGVAKLLDGFDFKPKFELGLFWSHSLSGSGNSKSTWGYFSGALDNSYFKLLDTVAINQLNSTHFFGYRIKGGINHIGVIGKSSSLAGVSLEFGKYNNTDDLKAVDRYESKIDNVSNTIVLSDKKSGFKGNYYENGMLRLNADYILFPSFISKQFGIGGYYRGSFGGPFARHNLGFGVFLSKNDAPDKVVLGIVYQFNDLFNQVSDEPNFRKRTGLSLTAGFNF